MAKRADPDPTDPEVEIEEPVTPGSGGVQVDLKEKVVAPDAAKAAEEAQERRWKALENQASATRRINEDLKKQVQQLNERLTVPEPAAGKAVLPAGTAQETIDKYDQLVADGKWQESVRLLAREEAKAEYQASRQSEQKLQAAQFEQESRQTALERSKSQVEGRYPKLHRVSGEPESPDAQLFQEAVGSLSEEDPEFLRSPYAPTLAMQRMEEIAESRGIKLTRNGNVAMTARPGRVGQTSMPASRGSGGATTYTLSREQKEWADMHYGHLPESERYKHYARFAKMAETGGVET